MSTQTYDDGIDPAELEDIPLRAGDLKETFILQPVRTLMHTKLGTIHADASILEAAEAMTEGHFGCIIVTEGPKLIGILSERDIMTKIVALNLEPSKEKVRDHMTPEPERLEPHDEIAYALNIMAIGGFRHVPIVDGLDNLVGIVSIRDLQNAVLAHFEKDILTLPPKLRHAGPVSRYGG
ncbi:MAG: CBS domain-containing protein [Acidobacteriota bacterium]|nr:CBS domain-containing protein [Acidobacteriota bacterium]